jgi:TPR repeat protein
MKHHIILYLLSLICISANAQSTSSDVERRNEAFKMTMSSNPQTVEKGVRILTEYANRGEESSIWNLAQYYSNQKGEYQKAASLYKKCYATSNDRQLKPWACKRLGDIYSGRDYLVYCDEYGVLTGEFGDRNGKIITPDRLIQKDLNEALIWYERAQSLGSNVSSEIEKVKHEMVYGEKEKLEEQLDALQVKAMSSKLDDARDGFQRLLTYANNGNGKAEGLVGSCYLNGLGTNQSIKDAVYWTKRGAGHDDTYALSELGIFYLEGLGIERNEQEFIRLETIAANRNFGNACYSLGQYHDAKGNTSEMTKWYIKACNLNHGLAFFNLSMFYLNNRQADKALDLLFKADTLEDQHKLHPNVHVQGAYQNTIGNIYGYGWYPVKIDLVKAKYWYEKAIKKGHAKAAMNMENLGL